MSLADCKYNALADQGFTTGSLNDREYQWLASQTGVSSGMSLNGQWVKLLTDLGYSGSLNDMQIQSWKALSGSSSDNWNDLAVWFWCTNGGVYGPSVRIEPQGAGAPTNGFCTYPSGDCNADRSYTAVDSGFDAAVTTWVWTVESGSATIQSGQGTATIVVRTTSDTDQNFELKVVASNAQPESAERQSPFTHYHREEIDVSIAESIAGSCSYDSGIGQAGCASQATYLATVTGTVDDIVWSLENVAGGTAVVLGGQGTVNCVIQTSGGTPSVTYDLKCNVTSDYQAAGDTQSYSQTKTDQPSTAPVFSGPIPDQNWILDQVNILDVSTYFTGTSPITYTIIAGALPSGMTLDGPTGIISGTPTSETTGSVTVRATNAVGSDDTNSFGWTVAESSGPAFHALVPDPLTYEMKGVLTGVGDLITTHASTLYAPDHEGVYRKFAENEPVWAGGRKVRNVMRSSTADSGSWGPISAGFNGEILATVTGKGSIRAKVLASSNSFLSTTTTDPIEGTFLYRVDLRGVGSSIGKTVALRNGTTGTPKVDVTLTADWVTHYFETPAAHMQVYAQGAAGGLSANDEFEVRNWQLETGAVTGQIPGEFVSQIDEMGDSIAPAGFDQYANWTQEGPGTFSDEGTYWEIIASGSGDGFYYDIPTVVGQTYIFSVECFAPGTNVTDALGRAALGSLTGSGGTRVNGALPGGEYVSADYWVPLTFVFTADSTSMRMYIQAGRSGSHGTAGDITRYRNPDLHMARSGLTAVFANENGNSIDGTSIVTEAVGAPLPDAPYLQYYPAAENDYTYSRDLTNAAWSSTATVSYDQIGLTGEPNTATLVADNDAGSQLSTTRNNYTIPTDTNPWTLVYYIKKNSDHSNGFPMLTHQTLGGVATIDETVNFDTVTGDVHEVSSEGSYEVVDAGSWWKLIVSMTNNGGNRINVYIHPARVQTLTGAATAAATGSIIIGNVELHLDKTIPQVRGLGPIFTTTAAVASDRTAYNFDLANHNATLSSWYNEVVTETSTSTSGSNEKMIIALADGGSVASQTGIMTQLSGKHLTTRFWQGSLTRAQITDYWDRDTLPQPSRLGSTYSAGEDTQAINGNGQWSSEVTFTDTGLGTYTGIQLYTGQSYVYVSFAEKMRNLQRYDIASYAAGKQIIDDLMSAPTFEGGDIIDLTIEDES